MMVGKLWLSARAGAVGAASVGELRPTTQARAARVSGRGHAPSRRRALVSAGRWPVESSLAAWVGAARGGNGLALPDGQAPGGACRSPQKASGVRCASDHGLAPPAEASSELRQAAREAGASCVSGASCARAHFPSRRRWMNMFGGGMATDGGRDKGDMANGGERKDRRR